MAAMRDPSARPAGSEAFEALRASTKDTPPETRGNLHHEAVLRELERWRAPVLTDEEIEICAKVFLMKRGHQLIPFFLWLDDHARRICGGGW
jgi:hypothetical protein